MGPRTSIEKRVLVLEHFKKGISQRKIAKIVDLSPSTVQHVIERFVHEKRVVNKGRQAPNKIFTEKECRWLVRQVKKNPAISAPKLAEMAEQNLNKTCHPETIRRALKEASLTGNTARNKTFISADKRKGKEKKKVTVNLCRPDGKPFVARKATTDGKPQNIGATIKHEKID